MTVRAGRYSTGADRKFALLEDLFKEFPAMPVSVEIKENNGELIEKVTTKFPISSGEMFSGWAKKTKKQRP